MLRESASSKVVATLVIADFSSIDCQLLSDAVERTRGFRTVGRATSSEELVATVCTHQPDMALISARLRDGGSAGLVALRKLRDVQPRCRSVILLDDSERELLVEAFCNGAKGVFCRSDGTTADLVKCIRCVHDGQVWVNNKGAEHIIDALTLVRPGRISTNRITRALSSREEEVSRLVLAGLSNREISEELGLSEHTIKNYLFRIFEKVGISTRTELVLYMLSQSRPPASGKKDCVSDHRVGGLAVGSGSTSLRATSLRVGRR